MQFSVELELSRPRVLHLHLSESFNTKCMQQLAAHVFVDDLYLPTLGHVRMSRKHMACSAVGVVDRRGLQNTLFVTFVGCAKRFEAY